MTARGNALVGAVAVTALGAAGVATEALADPRRAILGWLAAFGFGLGTALGALILAMVFHVTSARWPIVLRPYVLAIVRVTPLFALLFLPIAFELRVAYPWAHGAAEIPEHQRLWQSAPFFLARAGVYLAAWSILAMLLVRADEQRDRASPEPSSARERRISAAGLPILALTITFASFDWFMAVEPGWVSDMYGLYFFAGGLASAVSLVAIVTWRGARTLPNERAPGPDHFGAIGRLMLMATVLWAYIAFFQFLLVWIANLPREVGFYVKRSGSGYQIIDGVLVLGRFVIPFLVLLSRPLKRRAGILAVVAAWLVLMNAVDFAWLILPAGGGGPRALDVAPFLFVGGLSVAYGVLRFGRSTPDPALSGDPSLQESLRYRAS